MITGYSDPFEALFALQRAIEANIASDWMGRGTAGTAKAATVKPRKSS